MEKQYTSIFDTEYAPVFEKNRLLPDPGHKALYDIKRINTEATLHSYVDVIKWRQEFHIIKKNPTEENNVWFVITGCPRGEKKICEDSEKTNVKCDTYLDRRDNLIHVIEFGKNYNVGDIIKFKIEYETSGHAKEGKITKLRNLSLFDYFEIRYELLYNSPIDLFKLVLKIEKGKVYTARPSSFVKVSKDNLDALLTYKRENIRRQECIEIYSQYKILSLKKILILLPLVVTISIFGGMDIFRFILLILEWFVK